MPAAVQLLIFVVVMIVLWTIMTRGARNQQREMRAVQQGLEVGDEVIISAGIFGTVRSVDDAKVELEIAPDTVVTVARQVVVRRAEDTSATAPDADEAGPAGADTDNDIDGGATSPVETDEKSE